MKYYIESFHGRTDLTEWVAVGGGENIIIYKNDKTKKALPFLPPHYQIPRDRDSRVSIHTYNRHRGVVTKLIVHNMRSRSVVVVGWFRFTDLWPVNNYRRES